MNTEASLPCNTGPTGAVQDLLHKQLFFPHNRAGQSIQCSSFMRFSTIPTCEWKASTGGTHL